jgi:hypothetical protein
VLRSGRRGRRRRRRRRRRGSVQFDDVFFCMFQSYVFVSIGVEQALDQRYELDELNKDMESIHQNALFTSKNDCG